MGLKKHVFRAQLGKGMDTKSTDIVLEPGTLELLKNAVIEKTGKIQKRKGCSTFDWEATDDKPAGSFVYRDNLLLEGDEALATILGNDNETVSLGYNTYLESEISHVSGGGMHHQESPSIALSHSGNYFGVAWSQAYWNDSTGAINYQYRISIIDAVTGTIVNPDLFVSQYTKTHRGSIKIVAHGATDAADDSFAVYYEDLQVSNLLLQKVKLNFDTLVQNLLGATSAVTIAGASVYRQTAAEAFFDVVEHSPGSGNYQKVHVVFTEYSGGAHKITHVLDTDGTLSTGSTGLKSTASGATTHVTAYRSSVGGTSRIYYAYALSNVIHFRQSLESNFATHHTASDTQTGGQTIIETGGWCDSEDGTKVEYFCTVGTTSSTFISKVVRLIFTPASTTLDDDGVPFRLNAWTPLAPIKTAAGAVYFISQEDRNTEDNDLSLHTVSAWATVLDNPTGSNIQLYRGLVGATFRQSLVRSHVNGISCRVISDGTHSYSVLPRTTNIQTFVTLAGVPSTAINSSCHLIKFTTAKPIVETPRTQLGGELHFSPGSIKATSSERIHEVGFFYKPGISLTAQSAGNLDTDGVYKYRACWEWEDSYGNLHRSEPSDEETLTLTGSDTGIIVKCDGLSITMKDYLGRLNLVIYRTQGGGNVLNKVATVDVPDFNGSTAITALMSHTDLMNDANAALGAFLYTEGGELANVSPPASRYIESHRNRLFAISEDNRVWYSKEYENKVGLAFADTFQVDLDGLDHDKPTSLCSSGGELVIFRENSTWSISGEGPSKSGVGEFYKPRQVSATIGALKNSPSLYTDSGIYFQNIRGIFRMSGEGFEYIGAPVEDILGSSVIVAIRHHQGTETIRFALRDKVLAYNYRYNAWSVYEYGTGGIVGMENINDVIHIISNTGAILKEDASYKIGTAYMPMTLRTGWISFNEIQGFGRAYKFSILGKSHDAHVLNVKVYYDYDDNTEVDTYQFTTASEGDSRLQFRGHLSKQKCEAVKFEIYDADNSATTGNGFSIDHIALEVGVKRGIFRASTSNTIGAD